MISPSRAPVLRPFAIVTLGLAGTASAQIIYPNPVVQELAGGVGISPISIAAGDLRTVVDRTFPLDRAGAVAAHEYLHARRNLGKVVLVRQDLA